MNISLSIGAALSGSFSYAVSSAPKKLAKIGDALSDIKKRDTRLAMFQRAEADLEKSRAKLASVSRELLAVKQAMRGASGKELETLKNRSAALERQQASLGNRVDQARQKVRQAADAHRAAATAADTQTRSLGRLGRSIETIKNREESLQRALARRESAQQALGKARTGLFDAVAIGVGLKAAFAGAGELQAMLADIGITADIPADKMKEIGAALSRVARESGQTRESLASGLQVLVAAGLDSDRAVQSLSAIGKTATASGASVEDVSRTVFALLDNLKVAPGDAIKAMDMLVAAGKAGRFELKDMAQYFPAMTADAAKLGLTGTAAVAALGSSLQVALKGAASPSEAANNMKNFMAKITAPLTVKNFAKFGIDLEKEFKRWQEKGLNPIEQSLRLVHRLTDGDAFKMGELFNDVQVKAFITPLIQNVDEYKRIKREVESSTGLVESDAARRREEDPTQRWREMGEALSELRDRAILPLLPPLTKLINQFIAVAAPVSAWMAENETLVGVLGSTFATLLAGKVAFSAVAYGIGLVRVAWTAMGVVAAANPLGLAIMAIAVLAGVVWANWSKIKPLFEALWKTVSTAATAAWATISSAWSAAVAFFDGIWGPIASAGRTAWQAVGTAFSGGMAGVARMLLDWSPIGLIYQGISTALAALGVELPAKFSELGSMMLTGLVSGIRNMGGAVKDAVMDVGNNAVGWFKDKLGIKSPSRVFLALGGMVGEGAALGIGRSSKAVALASAALGAAATAAFSPAMGAQGITQEGTRAPAHMRAADTPAPVTPPLALQLASPTPSAPAAAGQAAGAQTIHQRFEFHITQQAGESGEALARRVADLMRRESATNRRAALGDWT